MPGKPATKFPLKSHGKLQPQSQPQPLPQLDVIIVGGGLAGLSTGLAVLNKFPKANVAILEKYGYIGGRVTTYHNKIAGILQPIHWENGAGRIATTHKLVLGLLKKYGLHTLPLSPESEFRLADGNVSIPTFEEIIPAFVNALENLSKDTLATNTLVELVPKRNRRRLFERYSYWAEPNLLRADLALSAFKEEMSSQADFVVCQEGLGSLAKAMADEFEKRGGIIYTRTEVTRVFHDFTQDCDIISCIRKDPPPSKQEVKLDISAKGTVLALHIVALANILKESLAKSELRRLTFLKHLKMAPLLRMYAIFPVRNGKSWFSDVPRTVTSSPIRFFIPIQPSKGIVMISYTEGPDATYWIEKMERRGENRVCREVMREIRSLFPEKENIPDPIFFKMHPWSEGCTYWLPGQYDPAEESARSIHPIPDILPTTFLCGESTSLRQAWMEGALEQAKALQSNSKFWEIFE